MALADAVLRGVRDDARREIEVRKKKKTLVSCGPLCLYVYMCVGILAQLLQYMCWNDTASAAVCVVILVCLVMLVFLQVLMRESLVDPSAYWAERSALAWN
jgi:hypothetical protein